MERRKLVIGTYDTDLNGPWTLASWELSKAEHRSEMVTVPGRDGELDMSTALTDGEPRYSSRTLTATLERSDGTRLEREAAINTMINWLDGWRVDIRLPDDDGHYLTGRVSVGKDYNDMTHAAVSLTATCDPWRYNDNETVHRLTAGTEELRARLTNGGRRTVIPSITITGGTVLLKYGAYSWALSDGVYQLPDLVVPQGGAEVLYSGTGQISFTYREAVL